MNSILCILPFIIMAASQNLTRNARQSGYICGSDPYKFYSNIPCDAFHLPPAVSENRTRNARQARYICGSDPYRFYSDIPCNVYPLCINGGFKINVGCTNDFQCQIHTADSICIDSCCCTIPRFVGLPTTQIFRDQGASSTSAIFAGVITLFIAM